MITWQQLTNHDAYEILNEYPFTIRKISTQRIIKEHIEPSGCVRVWLNGKTFMKRRVIATQFIPNPENLPYIDQKNRNRCDNRIENLRWVSRSENQFNQSSVHGVEYEFVNEIPNKAIVVNKYGEHLFEDLYYYDNVLYFYNGIQFRKLHINQNKCGSLYVNIRLILFYLCL